MNIKRGDIYYADLGKVVGSEQFGLRPVVIVQNNIGNKYLTPNKNIKVSVNKGKIFFERFFKPINWKRKVKI